MIGEQWLPVVGWEGLYEVSDQGRVRSLDRVVQTQRGPRRYTGKILRPGINRHGYPMVQLTNASKTKSAKVHRLVLEAFVGQCPEAFEACHNNGDRSDARLTNLRWDSRTNNMLEKQVHGTDHQKNKTHCPKGHEYNQENTKVIPSRPTARYCRQCHRDRAVNRWHTLRKPKKEGQNV